MEKDLYMNKYKAILIFCLLLSLLSYFIIRSKNINIASLSNFSFGLKQTGILDDKAQEMEADGKIVITEVELNTLLKPYAKTIQNFHVDITPLDIKASGETMFSTKASLNVVLTIKATEGKLSYQIKQINLGNIQAPKAITDKIIDGANKELEKQVNQKITVEKVEQDEDKITIYGKIK